MSTYLEKKMHVYQCGYCGAVHSYSEHSDAPATCPECGSSDWEHTHDTSK
jgi:rubrerythrin